MKSKPRNLDFDFKSEAFALVIEEWFDFYRLQREQAQKESDRSATAKQQLELKGTQNYASQ